MADISPQDMAAKLLASGFERSGPSATTLSDPIADTPIVVTLDQLRPYDHDPRVARNPAYEDIKASIRERGLDAAPAITRRPGEAHYLIRNGGNTRLAILRELWSETKQERFFRITCLFRPWPERGEVVMLTGHLAENELRGGLTFIERALGVEKARVFYEQESGGALTQAELAKRLSADGYPVQQSHISRMQDAVRYLLPAIPNVLYGGLGRHQVERISVLRKLADRIWERHAGARTKGKGLDFDTFFQDVLMPFDTQADGFSVHRVQDELIGQMATLLGIDYDVLNLDFLEGESRVRALVSEPMATAPSTPGAPVQSSVPSPQSSAPPAPSVTTTSPLPASAGPAGAAEPGASEEGKEHLLQAHVASPAPTTERLQAIQRLVAEQMGDQLPDFAADALRAIPVQAGSLYPISDVWYIDPGIDTPERLRIHIGQFALEIADEATLGQTIVQCEDGLGFQCLPLPSNASRMVRAAWALLASLIGDELSLDVVDGQFAADMPALLYGQGNPASRLSDTALVKLFRLLRLARRLVDLEAEGSEHDSDLGDGT